MRGRRRSLLRRQRGSSLLQSETALHAVPGAVVAGPLLVALEARGDISGRSWGAGWTSYDARAPVEGEECQTPTFTRRLLHWTHPFRLFLCPARDRQRVTRKPKGAVNSRGRHAFPLPKRGIFALEPGAASCCWRPARESTVGMALARCCWVPGVDGWRPAAGALLRRVRSESLLLGCLMTVPHRSARSAARYPIFDAWPWPAAENSDCDQQKRDGDSSASLAFKAERGRRTRT